MKQKRENVKITVITPTIRIEGLEIVQKSLESQTFQDFEWLIEYTFKGHGNDLNAAYNRAIKRARGELLVSWQDFIRIPNDGLEKMWQHYQDNPAFYTYPVSKQRMNGSIKDDWRSHRDNSKIPFTEWEIDLGAAPKQWMYEVGGFDEHLDEHTWTFDVVNVGLRAQLNNKPLLLNTEVHGLALDHDEFIEHPFRGDVNPEFHNKRLDDIRKGNFVSFL